MNTLGFLLASLWIVAFAYLIWRLHVRRRDHIGSAAIGTMYELLTKDRREAVEVIVEERTGERDHETADGNLPELEIPSKKSN